MTQLTEYHRTDGRVLVLDASWRAVNVIGWERAVTLLLAESAHAVVDSDRIISSPSVCVVMPSVIRVTETARTERKKKKRAESAHKRAIHERDRWTCGYCCKVAKSHLDRESMTIDHIFPKSRGGAKRDPANLITACSPCNARKDDMTPEEAGMKLQFPAREFTWHERSVGALMAGKSIPPDWLPFLTAV
jgi:5-methylcytosine-specific restriction endonuclease McrA